MTRKLQGKRIAILATDGVERIELEQPRGALYGAGATSELLSIHPGEIQARQFDMVSAGTFPVDLEVSDASVDDYDALLLPGGTVNPDNLRLTVTRSTSSKTLCRPASQSRRFATAHGRCWRLAQRGDAG
jgi:deglycase